MAPPRTKAPTDQTIGSVKQGDLVWLKATNKAWFFGNVIENNIRSLTVLIHNPEVKVEFNKWSGWSVPNLDNGFNLKLKIHSGNKLFRPGKAERFEKFRADLRDRKTLISTLIQATQADWGNLENEVLYDIVRLIQRHHYLLLINKDQYESKYNETSTNVGQPEVSLSATESDPLSIAGSGTPDQEQIPADDWDS